MKNWIVIINENDYGTPVEQKVLKSQAATAKAALAAHFTVDDEDPNGEVTFEKLKHGVVRFATEETDGFIIPVN